MWNAAVWTFIVGASAFAFGSVFLSNNQRRLHRNDAVELRRRQRMIDVLRGNIHVRHHTRPLDHIEENIQSATSGISDSGSDAQTWQSP